MKSVIKLDPMIEHVYIMMLGVDDHNYYRYPYAKSIKFVHDNMVPEVRGKYRFSKEFDCMVIYK